MKLVSNNFLDVVKISWARVKTIVVPFGFETTTTYGSGTKNGPAAIIAASQHLEFFDEEHWQESYKKAGLATVAAVKTPKKAKLIGQNLGPVIREILRAKKLPIVLGGEHSITSFILEAYQKVGFEDLSLLQFDAHADLRDGYLEKKYSHASAMRRSLDLLGINLVQIGIRSISNENDELSFWKKNQTRINTFWAKDKKTWEIEKIVECLKDKVYISFDVDAFDCSLMPATGTPEPGGLDWYEVLDILRAVCAKKTIIGADFVELAPIKNFHAPDFLVAKLIYKVIGYIVNNNKKFNR